MSHWAPFLVLACLAGCLGPGPSVQNEPQNETLPDDSSAETSSYSGSTGLYACVPTSLNTCAIVLREGAANDRRFFSNFTASNLTVELSWTPAGATTSQLRITALAESGCTRCLDRIKNAEGNSPLTLVLLREDWPENMTGMELLVEVPRPLPLNANAQPSQSFDVVLTWVNGTRTLPASHHVT